MTEHPQGQTVIVSRPVIVKLGEPFDWASLTGCVVTRHWTLKEDGSLYMIVREPSEVES